MKIIDTSKAVDPNKQQPFSTRSLYFLQRAFQENYKYIANAIVGASYNENTPYVIDGCVLSNANKDITNGHIFYKGLVYTVHGMTGSTGTPIRFLETLTPDATADPTTFSDGTVENVHIDHDYDALDSATVTYDFSATDLVYLSNLNVNPAIITYASGTTITTSAGTNLKLIPSTEVSDIDGQYSSGNFTPKKVGFYNVMANLTLYITASGLNESVSILLYKNSSVFVNRAGWIINQYPGGGLVVTATFSTIINVTSTSDNYQLMLLTGLGRTVEIDGGFSYSWAAQ